MGWFSRTKASKLLLCNRCFAPVTKSGCEACLELTVKAGMSGDDLGVIDSDNAIGLIGLTCTGKTCYMATLHDQLMHAAPDWRVEVSDYAFEMLTKNFHRLREGRVPRFTQKGGGVKFFSMKVLVGKQTLDLLMWDVAGEEIQSLCHSLDSSPEGDASSGIRDKRLYPVLLHCRTILVTIYCPGLHDQKKHCYDATTEDRWLGLLFRRLHKQNARVQQVIVLLVGVDVFGNSPTEANPRAIQSFEAQYRTLPGVIKNAGMQLEIVPLSNIGFGNHIDLSENEGLRVQMLPHPYNVLEPLRRAAPLFVPRGTRLKIPGEAAPLTPKLVEPAQVLNRSKPAVPHTAFLSYRRSGGAETARLLRSELQQRGWQVFLDVEDLRSSYFDDRLLYEIQSASFFLVILSEGALDRCRDSKDVLRREITHAFRTNRHIIPIVREGFTFPDADDLPEEMREIGRLNAIEYSHTYFAASMQKLLTFLDDIVHSKTPLESPRLRWVCCNTSCRRWLTTAAQNAGAKGRCPRCQKIQVAPEG